MTKLLLPSKALSWSQVSKWHKSSTHRDYIKSYFFKDKDIFENDYLLFGSYISELLESDTDFSTQPDIVREVLEQLDLLGNPETKITIEFEGIVSGMGFDVIGYADDMSDDYGQFREWKTGNLWTQEKVDAHGQLDTYASAVYKKHGHIPEIILSSMETKKVDTSIVKYKGKDLGVCFTGKVLHFERVVTLEDIERVDELYRTTAEEISEWWQVFSKLKKA